MKKMQKILCMLLALAMLLSFAACANPVIVQRPAIERSNMFFFFIRIAFLIICSAKDRAYFLFPFVL